MIAGGSLFPVIPALYDLRRSLLPQDADVLERGRGTYAAIGISFIMPNAGLCRLSSATWFLASN